MATLTTNPQNFMTMQPLTSDQNLHPIVGDRVIQGNGTSLAAWQAWQPLFDLPKITVASDFPPAQRVCIFAPHPDDEILGCGGLMQQLAENGNPILLVSVTNGTQSHPDSTLYSREDLHRIRPQETQNALHALGIADKLSHIALGLPDGEVFDNQDRFFAALDFLEPEDILVTVFAHDGHPDHEATGQVVSHYAKLHGMTCYQVLIWAWHWASPADPRINWQHAVRLDLTATQKAQKRLALDCFASQILPDPSTGQSAVLPAYAIERMMGVGEVFLKRGVLPKTSLSKENV